MGYYERTCVTERYLPTYFSITEYGSFEVRYDIQSDQLTQLMLEKVEEVAERKELMRHLWRREKYLKNKLIDGNYYYIEIIQPYFRL